ncbi:MAG: glutamine--fructose-6-phosphate transaminase (isomerizing) [Legionella sp.]|nr:glutamine--fructose-6-phosphate transaminase (isomerizing) [Legionella sp.]
MCGIMGAISRRDITHVLLEGLMRLEYRGYDSAGLAMVDKAQGRLNRVRMQGKVAALVAAVEETALEGCVGIAHTRWATHGQPSEQNAHPHLSQDEIALVHNGIIENHDALRSRLQTLGYRFSSDTDSEVAVHLIHWHYQRHENLLQAVQDAAQEMQGAFALGVIHRQRPDELIAIRQGSPLVIGIGPKEHFIASDALALQAFAEAVIYLQEGDCVALSLEEMRIFDAQGQRVQRSSQPLSKEQWLVRKEPYRHFMLKEIYEQSQAITGTLAGRTNSPAVLQASFGERALTFFPQIKQIHIVACGTSYHAGLIARYWLESLTGLATQVEIASEYRYRDVVVNNDTLFVAVSQSGETADTLAALRKAKILNYLTTLAICNVPASTLVRESECVFLTHAGVEIGVASTKAFTTQLTAFLMLATALCRDHRAPEVLTALKALPAACDRILKMNDEISALAAFFVPKAHVLFLGRGVHYPVALEGALKLKEISYIHAEAYPAGELKHGPLALIDKNMPVIAIAPNDELLDKLKSNLHEVKARGGQLIVFLEDSQAWDAEGVRLIRVPSCPSWIAPMLYTIPLQLLAYHVAVSKGTDVDQPRNLAKSVTVE